MSAQTEAPPQPAQTRENEAISDNQSQTDPHNMDTEDSKQVANLPETSESPAEPSTDLSKHHGEQQPVPNPNRDVETSNSGAPSVKLDLDLDIEVKLKAKIQGDLELAILDGSDGK
ncbi:hypothetical protein QQX98_002907 [Neonectria punicea]|uniref:Uncharacterized protein n=1 Tax=Neonectria punicea TaxID=979145 RepID=A0ABR1HGE6_9HYPO